MKYVVALTMTLLVYLLAGSATPALANGFDCRSSPSHPECRTTTADCRSSRDCGRSSPSCHKCPAPRPFYDTQEVIKDSKEIDHSKVIEKEIIVPSKRVVEINHLVVHENETINRGTILHKNIVIEKELVLTKRNVDHKHVNKVVDLVEHKHETDRRRVVEEREIPGEVRTLCNCAPKPLAVHAFGQAPGYVSSRY
jgi:hypothetical protein